MMALEEKQHFPLTEGFLCRDCQSVGNCSSACAACGSAEIDPIHPWIPPLDRPEHEGDKGKK